MTGLIVRTGWGGATKDGVEKRVLQLDATLGSVVNSITQWAVGTSGIYRR